jgi:putative spermidine/putrescine transport system permease protein
MSSHATSAKHLEQSRPLRQPKPRRTIGGRFVDGVAIAVFIFLLIPMAVIVAASFNSGAYLTFPPEGFSFRWYAEVLQSDRWLRSFRLSGTVMVITVPISLLIGILASYAIVRNDFPGKAFVSTLLLTPLVIPQIVLGLAFLDYFSRLGLVDSILGLVIAHVVVTLPYVIRSVSVSVQGLDPRLEMAAMNLGASPLQVFRRITLPLIRPGIVAGAIFAAIISFGELGVTLLIAGANTPTLPVRIFGFTEFNFDPTINAVSTLFIVLAIVLLIVLDKFIGLARIS